ncbi:MAG: Benzylsuccinate synthase activating enzyme [Planctomycetes bacterium ADurb.Bin126]|nr:MAG: Benzylsuccinate synthase activating enzyme [Planctomycetes bacterium ADurb.Bin126]HOD81395.1 glycyl-radical enzyme activating protein [Phycisphaerae bacterium]HQL73808.1 glycyl-radical enzyme activating protein [Phycisphaerae bacterium]
MLSGTVFHIQRFSIQDGPGIRTTVFLKGCPLDCWWCHNPEGRSARAEVVTIESRCAACGACRAACPLNPGVAFDGRPLPIDGCRLCGACVAACPTGARRMIGQSMDAAGLMDEVLKDRVFYDDSGGGVTFSGGEPLAQPQFVAEMLRRCRKAGLHTALDTCGHVPADRLLEIAPLADLVLYDLKLMDEQAHLRYTGVDNRLILGNLRALARTHRNVCLRVPLVPGVNDSPAELEALASFADEIGTIRRVSLLPYHASGEAKFRRLGEDYRLGDARPLHPDAVDRAAWPFRKRGLTVTIGG